jgi:hypothetical protein
MTPPEDEKIKDNPPNDSGSSENLKANLSEALSATQEISNEKDSLQNETPDSAKAVEVPINFETIERNVEIDKDLSILQRQTLRFISKDADKNFKNSTFPVSSLKGYGIFFEGIIDQCNNSSEKTPTRLFEENLEYIEKACSPELLEYIEEINSNFKSIKDLPVLIEYFKEFLNEAIYIPDDRIQEALIDNITIQFFALLFLNYNLLNKFCLIDESEENRQEIIDSGDLSHYVDIDIVNIKKEFNQILITIKFLEHIFAIFDSNGLLIGIFTNYENEDLNSFLDFVIDRIYNR